MAEAAGLVLGVVGLAALASTCIDLVEYVESYRNAVAQERHLCVQLNADKVILQKWMQAVGLTKDGSSSAHDPRLDDPDTATAVSETLGCVRDLFTADSHTSKHSHKANIQSRTAENQINQSLDSSSTLQQVRKRDRLAWALGRRQHFATQVELLGVFVQKLNQLVPSEGLHRDVFSSHHLKEDYINEPPSAILSKILRRLEGENREKFFAWLGPVQYEDRYEACRRRRTPTTCEWIFKRTAYIDWVESNFSNRTAKILWIHGAAGFGKSMLCANIVDTLKNDESLGVYHYFYPVTSYAQNDPTMILKAWMVQMVKYDPSVLERASNAAHQALDRAGEYALWDLFEELVQHALNNFFIIDGFDECGVLEQTCDQATFQTRADFLQKLKNVINETHSRVLIVSRAEPDIRWELSAFGSHLEHLFCTEYKIQLEDVQQDVLTHARSTVQSRLAGKDSTIKEDIASQIATRCEGMFLWIDLQAPRLRPGKTKGQLSRIVGDMPMGLDATYRRDWTSIMTLEREDKFRALDILRWVIFGVRALTISELTEILAIPSLDEAEDLTDYLPDCVDDNYVSSEIEALCGSLLEIRRTSTDQSVAMATIHLKHFSVKQFLLTAEVYQILSDTQASIDSTSAVTNNHLAISCLRYLQCSSVEQSLQKQDPERYFVDYAIQSWKDHISPTGQEYPRLLRLAAALLSLDNPLWCHWQSRYVEVKIDEDHEDSHAEDPAPHPIYYAAQFGLEEVVEHLYEVETASINSRGGFHGTPIKAACAADHLGLVMRMCQMGALLDTSEGRYGSILGTAVARGHLELCKYLLKQGVDVQLSDAHGRTPLYIASRFGHEQILSLLLDHGARISTLDTGGTSPTSIAAWMGNLEAVRILLSRGADVSAADSNGWTPLHLAASEGHLEIVRLLIRQGVNLSEPNPNGSTPLHATSAIGHLEIVRLLLDHGANVQEANTRGWMPIHLASFQGHLEIVRLLIERGANIHEFEGDQGRTPLYFASTSGHLEVTQLLLEHGANIQEDNMDDYKSIHVASHDGHIEIVQQFLDGGIDISTTNKNGRTPLGYACIGGNVEMVRFLLDRGADLSIPDCRGVTPLHTASLEGHLEVVRLLLDRGADLSALSKNNVTPLNFASSEGRLEVVQFLLDQGADLSIPDTNDMTPLHNACFSGHLEVVRLLLDRGADLSVLSISGATPLHFASLKGGLQIVQLLLDRGADPLVPSTDGLTPVHSASGQGHFEITRLLLEHGATCNTVDSMGRTPLHAATLNDHQDIINLLLETGIDPGARNRFLESSLHLACRQDKLPNVMILLENGSDPVLLDSYGRSALDWAELDPYFKQVLGSRAAEHTRTSEDESARVLRQTLTGLVKEASPTSQIVSYVEIGRVLKFLGDTANAIVSFQQSIRRNSEHIEHAAYCDACQSEEPVIRTDRYVCRLCLDFDLCQDCFSGLGSKIKTWRCDNHSFLHVPLNAPEPFASKEDGTLQLEAWLQSLQRLHIPESQSMVIRSTEAKKL